MLLLANSIVDGFFKSNAIGQGIVEVQLIGSVIMFAVAIWKIFTLSNVKVSLRRFFQDFSTSQDSLEYYITRRPTNATGLELIYKNTAERLLKLISPDIRAQLAGRRGGVDSAALTAREIELVRGTCEHTLEDAIIHVEKSMSIIATIVALEPMLGLLGTVWGVLDAFAEMGTAGSANLATIAPSISAALVTTVVGLIVAIPGVMLFNGINGTIRDITNDMEGFADELMGRIACEFQGRGA